MPSVPTTIEYAQATNLAFQGVIAPASLRAANDMLITAAVAPGAVGYRAYVKRMTLAGLIVNNPVAFAPSFARELMIQNATLVTETDPNNLLSPVNIAFDFVAGVNMQDLA
jgi:hypothetical protein